MQKLNMRDCRKRLNTELLRKTRITVIDGRTKEVVAYIIPADDSVKDAQKEALESLRIVKNKLDNLL